MTFKRLLSIFVLAAFAASFLSVPTANADKKSYKESDRHSAKHSDKSKKKHKGKKRKKKNVCKVENPDYVPYQKQKKAKKSKKAKHYAKHSEKSKKRSRKHRKHKPFIFVPAGEFFLDLDQDGFGDSTMTNRCPVEGYVATGGDCSVNDPLSFPGATEVCGGGIDNNCDGQVDELCGPAVCPCGTAEEIVFDFFSSPEAFGSTLEMDPEFDRVRFGIDGGNDFELDNRIGPEGIGCRLTIQPGLADGYIIEEGPLSSAEVEACTTEIINLQSLIAL